MGLKRPRIRPEILGFEPYSPGLTIGEITRRYKLDRVVKMASNENPLGVSPMAAEAIERHAGLSFRYPQAGNPGLTSALSNHLGVPQRCIVPGNGSDELIDLLVRVTARPGCDNTVVCDPSFSIYSMQAALCGVEVRRVPLGEGYTLPLAGLLEAADQNTGLVFVTTPDNPSGVATPAVELEKVASDLPPDTLLVIDEAYVEFTKPRERFDSLSWWSEECPVVILRTFSKMYGLAGLRLGYGIMPGWLADCLLRVRLPFSVNLLAEKAGCAALEDEAFVQKTLETVLAGRDFLTGELEGLGCRVTPSQANFLLFKPPGPARRIFEQLLARGVIVRPLAGYGLPDHLRVSMGTEEENRFFLKALQEVLDHG